MRWVKLAGWAVLGYAALVALAWALQRKLIYLPMGRPPPVHSLLAAGEEVRLHPEKGPTLGAWFVPAPDLPPAATVVVFNGNAGNRSFRAPLAAALGRAGYSVLLFDYRGYGENGGNPSEAGLIADATAARAYLDSRRDVDPDRIVYFGESLGAAVAVALAVTHPPAALVLRSPFTSLTSIGRLHYPFLPVRWLLRDTWSSRTRIPGIRCPLLVIAGERDSIVPHNESEALYRAATATNRRFLTVRGADHNDEALLAGPQFITAVSRFLKQALSPP